MALEAVPRRGWRPADRLPRPPLLPPGWRRGRLRGDALAVGPDLHRPELDRRSDPALAAHARLGRPELPRHEDLAVRVRPGRRRLPARRPPRPGQPDRGRHAWDLRARGARP